VRALTEALREALVAEVVHVEEPGHDPLVRELDQLYGRTVEAEVGGRLAATAAIAAAVNSFASEDPARVERVRGRLQAYLAALAAAGVDDWVVRAEEARRPSLLEDLGFYLGAPLALWGALNHAVYYQIPRLVVALLLPDRMYGASLKLVSGLLALAGCYAAQTWGVLRLTGDPSWALVYLGTLPVSGLVALLWLEGLALRRRAAAAKRRRAALDPDALADLTRQRAELILELDRARVEFLARHLDALAAESDEAPL
jgi:hypothetical protein